MLLFHSVLGSLVILVCFLLTMGLTSWLCRLLVQQSILDHPNERSAHHTPVPRGGGWALVMVFFPCLMGASLYLDHTSLHFGLLLGLIVLIAISWLDDQKHVPAALRLSLHIVAACLGSSCFTSHEMLFQGALPFWLDRTLMIVGWAWFLNLYNFMDGIDGITCVETIVIATGLCLILSVAGIDNVYLDWLTLILTGTCLGFLVFNWHPARIFLGDVGSVPLGFLVGFGLISIAVAGHIIATLILPLYYLADSGLTIGKRALRGEKIWQAHRQHFYQRAAQATGRHDTVVLWIITANVGLLGAAALSLTRPVTALAFAILIVAVLLRKMHKTPTKL